MKTFKRFLSFLCSAALTPLLVDSCVVDKNFDKVSIGDINTEMTLMGDGLQFPLGDVKPVTVKELMEKYDALAEYLTADEQGNYHFTMKGGYDMTDALDDFDMQALRAVNGNDFTYEFETTLDVVSTSRAASAKPASEYAFDVNEQVNDFEMVGADVFSQIPEELEAVTEVYFEGTKLNFGISPEKIPDWDTDIYCKDAVIVLPEYVFLQDGSHELHIPDGKFEVGKELVGSAFIDCFKGRSFQKGSVVKETLVLRCRLTAQDPNPVKVASDHTLKLAMRSAVGNGTISNAGNICISKVHANVNYTLNQELKMEFDNIPDILKGDGVVLDLDPTMMLKIATNLNVPMTGSLMITPYFAGKPDHGSEVVINNVQMPCSESSSVITNMQYYIGSPDNLPEGETSYAADLGALIRKIPDYLVVTLKGNSDRSKTCVFETDSKYSCTIDYELDAALAPGEDFAFTLTPEAISLDNAASYLKYITGSQIGLTGVAVSTLPVGVTLYVSFLDSSNNVLATDEELKLRINPAAGSQKASSALALALKFTDPGAVPAKLSIKAVIDAESGADCINESDYVEVRNLVLVLPEGITINPVK